MAEDVGIRAPVGAPGLDVVPPSRASRALAALLDARTGVAVVLVVVLAAGAWALVHLGGGAARVVPHTYYVPVMVAALRFGRSGALATALGSGLLAGPLTHQVVAGQVPQSVSEWVTRTVAFVLVGQVVAWLFHRATDAVREEAQLTRSDAALVAALRAGELSLRYQPIVDGADGSLRGFEALVRWDHPDGERGPCAFLPAAERTGRIVDVGRFVLDAACAQAARWYRESRAAGCRPPTVGINVAAVELADDAFVERVRAALRRHDLPGEQLCLEVTEGALIADLEGSVRRLRALREDGVRIVVDDFGTGYSSLSYVHRFPLDVLKIDRSFVVDLEDSEPARALVGGIVALCRTLGVRVVAEGVETAAQAVLLRRLGCPMVQGYHLAVPARAEELAGWMARCPPVGTPTPALGGATERR